MKLKIILLLSVILYVTFTFAQTRYNCDFEDDVENSNWSLNVTANPNLPFANKWYIGNGINNGGDKSLYISKDGGLTPGYGGASMMISVRPLTLDAGVYELSFDWLGGYIPGKDVLYVGWVPDSVKTNSSPNNAKPDWFSEHGLYTNAATPPVTDSLRSSSWKTSAFHFTTDGSPHKLVFAWTNTTNNSALIKGACVDNIQIIPEGACDAPQNLQLTTSGSSVTLSWGGNAPLYEVKYYSNITNQWIVSSNINSTSITFYGMSEGVYQFYVRSLCGTDKSRWVSKSELIYLPDLRCIDYLSLTDQNCWIGSFGNPGTARQKVDFGYESLYSRHTVHSLSGEYDSYTGNGLKTIPDGEIASVRLGNPITGTVDAERIEYSYKVDASTASVLVLKYAVILNEPATPHDPDVQAYFDLKILRKNGTSLDLNKCGEARFVPSFDTNDPSWHSINPAPVGSGTVWWKEWTTVGINLKKYDGEELLIRLTTSNCSQKGHYGYAYFTLGCTNGEMEGISCGDTPTTQFIAPLGFNYNWYLPEDPSNSLETSQIFNVNPMDTLTYNCDVIFPTNPNCYFTLTASAVPRYPVAETQYTNTYENCTNNITFTNTSHIMLVNQITTDSTHTPLPVETVFWDFGDGITSTEYHPTHIYPKEGGTFTVSLHAGISNNVCLSDTTFLITLPDLSTTYDTVPASGCLGSPWTIPGTNEQKWGDGLYPHTLTSVYGCDSIIVYDLKFYDEIKVSISETIFAGESYEFDNRSLTETGTYTATDQSVYGCDSITTLYLTVMDTLRVELSDFYFVICADDYGFEIPFMTNSGGFTYYDVIFRENNKPVKFPNIVNATDNPISISLPDRVIPGVYQADVTFYGLDVSDYEVFMLDFTILYPDSIITQRWNDVLSVRNSIYNGGYEFSSFQWYKDGVEIPGATKSYLYVPGELDFSAVYAVNLIQQGQTESIMSCDFTPERISGPFTIYPTAVKRNMQQTVEVPTSGTISIFDVMGVKLGDYNLEEGKNTIKSPNQTGIYLYQIRLKDGDERTYRISVSE